MAAKKHDWVKLEQAFLAGKYLNLKDMAKKTNITYRMIQKMSSQRKWTDKRKRIDDEVQERGTQLMIESRAEKIAASDERALKIAEKLVVIGASRFLDKDGSIKKNLVLESDYAAIAAIKTGIHIEQSILKRTSLADKDGDIVNINQINMKELSDAQLLEIIHCKDPIQPKTS